MLSNKVYTFSMECLRARIYRNRKNLLYFLYLTLIKISSHSKYWPHLFCIFSFCFLLFFFFMGPINITNNWLLVWKIDIGAILINIILIGIPKSFKFPFFWIWKGLLNWMHKFDTKCGSIIFSKETENKKVNKLLVVDMRN